MGHIPLSRRTAASLILLSPTSLLAQPLARLRPAYTETTAPDAIGRKVLARRLKKMYQGASKAMNPGPAIHTNLPQVIEQNFARMDAARASRFMLNVGKNELSDLAQVYTNAVSDVGREPLLLDLLAVRMTPEQLGQLSMHFGFVPTYSAVLRAAPSKTYEFQQRSSTSWVAPIPGLARFGPRGIYRLGSSGRAPLLGEWFDWTPYEVYLNFRTAPIGSLGVTASLYETLVLFGRPAMGSFGTGFVIGTVISDLIQTYAPSLWETIGGTINQIIENLIELFQIESPQLGPVQQQDAETFQLNDLLDVFEQTGGDFGVVQEWQESAGNGGGHNPECWECIVQP